MDRLVPYKSYSYERDLIEYCGTVIVGDEEIPTVLYATPGLTVQRNSAGSYTISLTDKLPIFDEIANSNATPANLTCIDKGFASSCMIWTSLRPENQVATTDVRIGASAVRIIDRAQIAFDIATSVVAVATDLSFSFRLWITGQPAKFVQSLGA